VRRTGLTPSTATISPAVLINDEGSIKIGDKDYKLVLRYYDDE
jgi:hypothetical protein